MPIYEFDCKPCSKRFELLTSPSRISEAKCPVCGTADVKRVFSTFFSRSGGSGGSHSHGGGGCSSCSSGNCSSCSCH